MGEKREKFRFLAYLRSVPSAPIELTRKKKSQNTLNLKTNDL